MIVFKKTSDKENKFDITNVIMELEHEDLSLHEVLEEFEAFVRAIRYCPKGTLRFVEDE